MVKFRGGPSFYFYLRLQIFMHLYNVKLPPQKIVTLFCEIELLNRHCMKMCTNALYDFIEISSLTKKNTCRDQTCFLEVGFFL